MDDLTLASKAGAYPGKTPKCAFSKILYYPMMKNTLAYSSEASVMWIKSFMT